MSGKRILIVEDNEDLAMLQAEVLNRHFPECNACPVRTGAQAKSFLQLQAPDVLVLDLTIPPPDGLSLLRWMHTSVKEKPHVVVTTGCTEQLIQQQALQLGASYCLLKPYSMNDLLDTISLLLQEDAGQNSPEESHRRQMYMACVKQMLSHMTERVESEGYRFVLLCAENYFDFGRNGITMKAISQKLGYTRYDTGDSSAAETAIYRLIKGIVARNTPQYQALCRQFGVADGSKPTVRRFLSMMCEAALQQIDLE